MIAHRLARTAESDLYFRPDPSTLAVLPWEETIFERFTERGLQGV